MTSKSLVRVVNEPHFSSQKEIVSENVMTLAQSSRVAAKPLKRGEKICQKILENFLRFLF